MNPKDGKDEEKEKGYTFPYLLWENILISKIPKDAKNGCNASYQKSKPSILFLTTAKSRGEGKNRKVPVESYPHQTYVISFQNLSKYMTISRISHML